MSASPVGPAARETAGPEASAGNDSLTSCPELRSDALRALLVGDRVRKLGLVAELAARASAAATLDRSATTSFADSHLPIAATVTPSVGQSTGLASGQLISFPGYPAGVCLVAPNKVKRRKVTTERGRIALLHSLAHIEWNAVNLALDAVHRFDGLPEEFYTDWIGVAAEEARHYAALEARLQQFGSFYGALPAHQGLWEMAVRTADDLAARMALVPRVLEARGLDVTPGLIERLAATGDQESVAILEMILREEVGHVAIGSRWFAWECRRRGTDPEPEFQRLVGLYMKGRLKGPFNHEARLRAGFSPQELAALEQGAAEAAASAAR